MTSEGWPASGSCIQNVEAAPCGRMMPVTTSVTGPVATLSVIRLPGCSPNRAAVCVLTATATVPAGSAPAVKPPATSVALLVSRLR